MAKIKHHKPLRGFDYKLVQDKLDGLLINVDRDLQRLVGKAEQRHHGEAARCLMLLNLMVRFAMNSYHAVMYLTADVPEDHKRKARYVMVIPTINRQLLDLLFSLVYMLDDLQNRSLQYQRAGWREAYEESQRYHNRFARDKEWKQHFKNLKNILASMVSRFQITDDERKNPKLVPYWKHPYQLSEEKTPSRPYLQFLKKWLYGDTSAQAHLSFGGLIVIAPFLIADIIGGQHEEFVMDRIIHQYRFIHVSRTSFVTLAIATEIDVACKLRNKDAASYLWRMFAEYSDEASDLYEQRYERLLQSDD